MVGAWERGRDCTWGCSEIAFPLATRDRIFRILELPGFQIPEMRSERNAGTER